MPKRIVIDPVTRIEGHARISIQLDEDGHVADACFHVVEFRGFERFCEGRPLWEMPALTARTCGICPVSHLLASARAGDEILAVRVPPAADKLRRLMNLGQMVQSHALSFFHLSAPDFLMGWETPPADRNVFGLLRQQPELVRAGVALRQFGQEIIEILGGRRVHPSWAVPGGVREGLSLAGRERIRAGLPAAFTTSRQVLDLFKSLLGRLHREVQVFGNFPSLFLGLVGPDGEWEHHGGRLRFMDSSGSIVADQIEPARYREFIAEAVQPASYLKSPYFRPLGCPDGMYRVGPLARLNVCRTMGTPRADAELREFRGRNGGPVTSSFLYHQARLIEILACLERIESMLEDPDLHSDHLRADAGVNRRRGVGVSEAPRGTLFHEYEVDEDGLITRVNLVIATGQNNLAMNRTVCQIAKHYVRGDRIPEAMLNRIEHGIRAFDPCLSCSTHALGQMPLRIQLRRADGSLADERCRD